MGFKSVMKKIGKVALAAAPYVAAPFTGGASLSFAPMTKQALSMWNQHDANAAAAKGLAPSKFDSILGMGTDFAGMAGGMGAFGKISPSMSASKFNAPMSTTGKSGILAQVGQGVMDRFGGQGQGGYSGGQQYSRGNEGGQDYQTNAPRGLGPQMSRQQQMNPMGMMDQNNPNLSSFIGQGRSEAINDQPFRRGYTTNYLGSDDETPMKARMPKIGSVQPPKQKKRQRETVN